MKRIAERKEKEELDEQAKIWEVDRLNSINEEKQAKEKHERMHMDTAAFLKQQMTERLNRVYRFKMNRNELQFNKGILRTVNEKLREYDQHGENNYDQDPTNGQQAEQTM